MVIFNFRGNQKVGSTFIKVIERNALRLKAQEGKSMLSGVHKQVMEQVERTETTEAIAREDILLAQARVTITTRQALERGAELDSWGCC